MVENEGNPIEEGARVIRKNVLKLVQKDLGGYFPRNNAYSYGDANLIYTPTDERRQNRYKLVAINPKGEFQSGWTCRLISSWSSHYELRDAQWYGSTDLEVVKYAPDLVDDLLSKVLLELPEQDNPAQIHRMIKALSHRDVVYVEDIFAPAWGALQEMGEEETNLPIIRSENETLQAEILKFRGALSLYEDKNKLIEDIKSLSMNMRVKPVEEYFQNLIANEIQSVDIFSGTSIDSDGSNWLIKNSFENSLQSRHTKRDNHYLETWLWAISPTGLVREYREFKKNPDGSFILQHCPQHLLEQGPQIAEHLINQTVQRYFPKLK